MTETHSPVASEWPKLSTTTLNTTVQNQKTNVTLHTDSPPRVPNMMVVRLILGLTVMSINDT